MNLAASLEELQHKAQKDENLKMRFIHTKAMENPLQEFCKICRELGYEIYAMDMIVAGEEYYAAMRRSTNGGGENSPKLEGEDDYYELFLACLEMKAN